MTKTIDTLTITATGLSDTERMALEKEIRMIAQARIDRVIERDHLTREGLDEIERCKIRAWKC